MVFVCNLCNTLFIQKGNLDKHLRERRCKSELLDDWVKLNNFLNVLKHDNRVINKNVLSINDLNTEYIEESKMKSFIEIYDKDADKLVELLCLYIREIIHNKDHVENHCIKYINKRSMIFSILIQKDDKNENVIGFYKEICNIASDYILNYVLKNLKKCVHYYKNDVIFQDLYEDTIIKLKGDIKKNILKSLNLCLKRYILNDIDMKF